MNIGALFILVLITTIISTVSIVKWVWDLFTSYQEETERRFRYLETKIEDTQNRSV